MHTRTLDPFTLAYLEAALWTSDDDPGSGEWSQHGEWTIDRIASETIARAVRDCRTFQNENTQDLDLLPDGRNWSAAEQAGHDFWLTRNHHGAGFWDRGNGDLGERLTTAAHGYGEVDLYRGDDGLLYFG